MDIKSIVITGANGTIGTVLQRGLHEYPLKLLKKPSTDIRNYEQLSSKIDAFDTIIHLAWDSTLDNYKSENINPDNSLMTFNIYHAAFEKGVKRIIIASSVHADTFCLWKGPGLLTCDSIPTPDSPYGAHKNFMESLGRYYAAKGMDVICIRFGGINAKDIPNSTDSAESAVYLSHRDCINLFKNILTTPVTSHNFTLLYAVSNNPTKIHDTRNPFKWNPIDNSSAGR